jgi:hypothetical protein
MKLQRREKILLGVTGGLLGFLALIALWFFAFGGDSRSTEQLTAEQEKLTGEIEKKERQLKDAGVDAKRLADWRKRALPTERASELYNNWLLSLVEKVHFRSVKLTGEQPSLGKSASSRPYTRIQTTVTAQAKLGDLVQFLYEFYSTGFLHQIHDMTVKPVPGGQSSRDLDIKLTIVALSLPGAEAKNALPKPSSLGLKLPKLADYAALAKRNLFASYVKPEPPRRVVEEPVAPRRPAVDLAAHAYVTAFIEVDGVWQVWLQDRIQGKPWKLASGDNFTVGTAKGIVQVIHPEGEAIVEYDKHRYLLRLGDTLRGGKELERPKEQSKQPTGGAEPTRSAANNLSRDK